MIKLQGNDVCKGKVIAAWSPLICFLSFNLFFLASVWLIHNRPEVIAGLPNCYFSWISLLFLLAAHIYWFGISGYAVTSHVSGPKPLTYLGSLLDASSSSF